MIFICSNCGLPWHQKSSLAVATLLISPLLWIFCWLGILSGLFFLSGIVVLFGLLHAYGRNNNAREQHEGNRLFLVASVKSLMVTCSEMKSPWIIPASTLLPCIWMIWANQYFNSFLINTGIMFIYVIPSTLFLLSEPQHEELPRKPNKHFHINLPLLSIGSILFGVTLVMMDVDILSTEDFDPPTSLFYEFILLDSQLSHVIGQFFFSFLWCTGFYLMGFFWVLQEDQLPCYPRGNMVVVVLSILILLSWKPLVPSVNQLMQLPAGLVTYKAASDRLLSM